MNFIEDYNQATSYSPALGDFVIAVALDNVSHSKRLIDTRGQDAFKELTFERAEEMLGFYNGLLDILIQEEMYEQCSDTKYVIEILEKNLNFFPKEVGT